MLSGEAVVAIWNGITEAGRAEFYAWHLHEHMPERVGIPGFRRGRRYIAVTPDTQPEFFTLYETETMQVLQGSDYRARLDAPTPWTRTATAEFRDTARVLARVLASAGPGAGGVAMTVRFTAAPESRTNLATLLRSAAEQPRICGAHLCAGDAAASATPSAESAGRTDLQLPPDAFAMVEGTDAAAVDAALPPDALAKAGARNMVRGIYRLEYSRGRTAFAAS